MRTHIWRLLCCATCLSACDSADDVGTVDTDPTDLPADHDEDGVVDDLDCAPNDGAIYPGAIELPADGIDQDCDGLESCYVDRDGDGWGDALVLHADLTCTAAGIASRGGDCRDDDDTVSPDATESCNGIDSDCNGRIDDGADTTVWAFDRDNDGVADLTTVYAACEAPPGYRLADGEQDCDDLDPATYPGADEVPGDGIDQDCDGRDHCYVDADGDGFGDLASKPGSTLACDGFFEASNADDCDDTTSLISPVADEVCGTVDHDCDGLVGDLDDDTTNRPNWYQDSDGDGFGNEGALFLSCVQPEGTVADHTDCNDARGDIHPDADERCDNIDNDCDTYVDDFDDDAIDPVAWHRDRDRDRYGSPTDIRVFCAPSADYDVRNGDDCNDLLASVNPDQTESPGNTLDEDCDGTLDCFIDADGDGAASGEVGQVAAESCNVDGFSNTISDCDDTDPEVQRFLFYTDLDQDGFGNVHSPLAACVAPLFYAAQAGDCNDSRADINPSATEQPGDEIDSTCDGTELCYADHDGDGFGGSDVVASPDLTCRAQGEARRDDDCDDGDLFVFPGALERIGDGFDGDCDGRELCFLDADGDHYGVAVVVSSPSLACDTPGAAPALGDCDDLDVSRNPGAAESCAPGDENCNNREGDDDPTLTDAPTWFADDDHDGLGDDNRPLLACAMPLDHVDVGGDCDDRRAAWGEQCPFADVAVGDAAFCARRTDGEVVCDDGGSSEFTPPLPVMAQLDLHTDLACGVDAVGTLHCWGPATDGRAIPPQGSWQRVALGPTTACALDAAGSATCWGDDSAGLVSDVPTTSGFTDLTVGDDLACAVSSSGIQCWGDDTCSAAPSTGDLVRTDSGVACTLDGGVVSCGGCDVAARQAPTEPLLRFASLDVGTDTACAVTVSGDLTCWGDSLSITALPALLVPSTHIAVGRQDACVVDADGFVTCWGANAFATP